MRKRKKGLLKNIFIIFISFGIFLSGGVLLWVSTFEIPDLQTFDERKVAQSTKIYDRTGEILLYDIHQDIQRTIIPFEKISRHIKNATVAIEDAAFYKHNGIQPSAFIRAVFVNLGALDFKQGGSTITQQVVKNSILTTEKTITRKLKEWFLALKLEKAINKEAILELYLNEAPYGGNIYGIEEASRVFFDKNAGELTLPESAYLAAIPQAPTYYSPFGNNKDDLEKRKDLVLQRMFELGFINEEEYSNAQSEEVIFQPRSTIGIKAPHFVFFVREYLEKKYGKERVERGGLKITTTLDWTLQEKGEEIVATYTAENVEKFNAHNAGLVAVDPKTGQILTMVGSRDYFDPEIDGNFNVTINPNRQPGSAFKPFVYATAFMKGYTPETIVFDLETQFDVTCTEDDTATSTTILNNEENTEDSGNCYTPENYDGVYRGPVTLRNALAQSINVPAIKTLYLVGIQEALTVVQRMGITSLTDPNRYGLTLVLGGGETSLLDMTSAYSVFANNGVRNPYTAILQIETTSGDILERYTPKPSEVLPEDIALQISDVLSDNDARAPAFGQRSYLYFDNADVASKTGTTNDYRDAWIIGYTPTIAAGAWAGNNDNSPMEKKVAGFIIAPLWNAFMKEAIAYLPKENFKKPALKEVETKDIKPIMRGEWMGGVSYFIDTISGKRATQYTPEETKKEYFITDIHSILYWVDKNNPLGDNPQNPENDPQFELWEEPVKKWVENQNIQEHTISSIPTEYDPVHKPEFAPIITIQNFNENTVYPQNQRITIQITSKGKFPLIKVDLFINNIYIDSSQKNPFMFSFVPNDIGNIQEINTLKIIGYDMVMNKGEKLVNLKVNLPPITNNTQPVINDL